MVNNFEPNYAIHPGVFLKEEMEMMGITQKSLAATTGVSKTIINEVINGKRKIGAELAVKLEKALYSSASYWLNLQAIYDEAVARIKLNEPKRVNIAFCERKNFYISVHQYSYVTKNNSRRIA